MVPAAEEKPDDDGWYVEYPEVAVPVLVTLVQVPPPPAPQVASPDWAGTEIASQAALTRLNVVQSLVP